MFVKRQRGGEESASGELQCLWVCVECVLVLGWCCSGTEGTCIFAIKLLPMRAHRGRNHRAGPSVVISYLKNKEKKNSAHLPQPIIKLQTVISSANMASVQSIFYPSFSIPALSTLGSLGSAGVYPSCRRPWTGRQPVAVQCKQAIMKKKQSAV